MVWIFSVFSWWTLARVELLGQLQQDLWWRHPAETESVWRAPVWWRALPRWKGRAEALQWEEMPRLVTLIQYIKLPPLQYKSIKKEITHPSTYACNFTEPHEICPEQNTGDVVWKRTPAGDMAAVACPADASGTETARTCFICFLGCLSSLIMQTTSMYFLSSTGLILRRCTLDAVGLASWENPTYIKCVSKNYETIQMLVSP